MTYRSPLIQPGNLKPGDGGLKGENVRFRKYVNSRKKVERMQRRMISGKMYDETSTNHFFVVNYGSENNSLYRKTTSAGPLRRYGGSSGYGRHNKQGVSPKAISEMMKSPLIVLQQTEDTYLYLSDKAAGAVNKAGKLITVYGSKNFDGTI
jgi:hypothetical protein